jgi:hypothetical protein
MKRPGIVIFMQIVLSVSTASALGAQESPFVPEKLALQLANEISGDRAFNYVRLLTPYHRIMGSPAFVEAAKMLGGLAGGAGLENVQVVRQKFEGGLSWNPRSAKLWMIAPEETKLADFEDVTVSLAVFSRSAHLTAELVDAGRAAGPDDFRNVDVAGKVVLTTAPPGLATRTAVWERGALGVVSCGGIHPESRFDTPDQIAYIKVPASVPPGKTAPWAFNISAREHGRLEDLLREGKAKGIPVKVRVDIDTEILEPTEQAYLWAEMKGAEIHDQDIVLTAHLDEESTSANDNGSGCAAILEVGRAINALVRDGRIARPKRDIVFWWPNEHSSEYQYFREHPGEPGTMLASINLDMVGARQSMGSRVQQLIRTPFSMPSYLNDVAESILDYVILANSAFRSAEETGSRQPYSKPILAFAGSRERFNAMAVPQSGGSDHEVFLERLIGVPAVSLINDPDPYFHSSDDDLWNIDRTQLKRNAFITAAATLFLANAGDGDVPLLAEEVYSRGMARLGKDLNTALAHVRKKKAGDYARSYSEARNLIKQAGDREKKAIESVLVFAKPGGRNAAFASKLAAKIGASISGFLQELDASYLLASGEKRVPEPVLSPAEKAMAARVPENAGSLDEYFSRRGWSVSAPGLHSIMAKECYCFVDGKKSYLDIYLAVHAEAMSGGEFYYGKVTPEAVRDLLDKAVDKGVIKLRS